jgi:hypothetical protein
MAIQDIAGINTTTEMAIFTSLTLMLVFQQIWL